MEVPQDPHPDLFARMSQDPLMQGFVPASEYEEAVSILLSNKQTILGELRSLLASHQVGRQWAVWAGPGHDPPCFTRISSEELKRLHNENVGDPVTPQLWTLFGLRLFGHDIEKGKNACPLTHSIVRSIPNMITAGFSCLGPGAQTNWHADLDRGFDRIHLPLIIPPGEIVFQVQEQTRRWGEEEVIIFDDTRRHNAYNHTEFPRFVLLVDVQRSPGRQAAMMRANELRNKSRGPALAPSSIAPSTMRSHSSLLKTTAYSQSPDPPPIGDDIAVHEPANFNAPRSTWYAI